MEAITETIKVTGLSCADCATKLERRVAALPGVIDAAVNFAAGKLVVTHHEAQTAVLRAIADAGYGVEVATIASVTTAQFLITGLDCPDCAAKLGKTLARAEGIDAVDLNPMTGRLTVQHRSTPDEIVRLVAAAGYVAAPITGTRTTSSVFLFTNRRFLVTAIAGVLLVAAAALNRLGGETMHPYTVMLFLAAMLIGGYQTIRRGLLALKARTVDMNVLMTIAIIGASLIHEWSEGATVAFLYSVSNYLESFTLEKTRQSIRGLMELAPREALVRRNGVETRLPVEQVRPDDMVIVKPGEKIAVDGVVAVGASSVNQAAITGESLPVEKSIGDEVYAGTLNELGALEIRVTRLAEDSTLAKIVHLVEEAQSRRAPAQAFVDRFAAYYTPAVLAAAALFAVIPPLFFHGDWNWFFYRALTLVVVACPCALVISTPVAIITAIGNAARHGVLIKGGAYLEQAGRLAVIAFDKTGTLTRGRPEITDIVPLNGTDQPTLLAMAAAVETRSPHPLAEAVLRKARAEHIAVPATEAFTSLPGKGARATVAEREIIVGNPRLFAELGIDANAANEALAAFQRDGKTAMLVGDVRHVLGILAAADRVRPESRPTVQALHRAGIARVVMLTGDHPETARRIAAALGVDDFTADLLPADKVDAVRTLQGHGAVGMVGDGINDAPALATADVGFAMGVAGTDTALETADIALMADDLAKLPYTIRLSRKALSIIRQNIAFSLLIKALAITLIFPGWLTLWMAVLADMGASLLVTLNGLRLLGERPEPTEQHCGEQCECCDCH